MKKFKVIALSCTGKGNKVHHAKEVVNESDFNPGHAEKMVKEGFLKPLSKAEVKTEVKAKAEVKTEVKAKK